MGIGAVIATTGLLLFVGLVVATVFFGRSNAGRAMVPWHVERRGAGAALRSASGHDDAEHRTPGTFVLAMIFLLSFAVYYFANWMWLSDVWHVR